MVAVTFHGTSGDSLVNVPKPKGDTTQIIIEVDLPRHPKPEASPSLCSRVAKGLFSREVCAVALVASSILLANQTEAGAALLMKIGSEAIKFAPEINIALSAIWAIPCACRAGSKKMSAVWLAVGAISAGLPYSLQPGFTIKGAINSVVQFGTSTLAFLGVTQAALKDEI